MKKKLFCFSVPEPNNLAETDKNDRIRLRSIYNIKIIFTVTFFDCEIDMSTFYYLFRYNKKYLYEISMEYERKRSRSRLLLKCRGRQNAEGDIKNAEGDITKT